MPARGGARIRRIQCGSTLIGVGDVWPVQPRDAWLAQAGRLSGATLIELRVGDRTLPAARFTFDGKVITRSGWDDQHAIQVAAQPDELPRAERLMAALLPRTASDVARAVPLPPAAGSSTSTLDAERCERGIADGMLYFPLPILRPTWQVGPMVRPSRSIVVLFPLLAVLAGCPRVVGDGAGADAGPNPGWPGDGETVVDAGSSADAGPDDPAPPDPFVAQPDTDEGLTNTSADLNALLEHGDLEGACDAWASHPDDRRQKLLCGKSMFFYEGFGTIGVPRALLEFFGNRFPAISGTAWSGIGLVPDPTHPGVPLGVGPGAPLGNVETFAFTCASCHFGPLPDGRYSVGAPNHGYDYGEQILAISLPAKSVAPGFEAGEHHPAAMDTAQPYIDALAADRPLRLELLIDLLPLIGAEQPTFDVETEGHYASWPSGTMDFMMAPLPLDDGAHTVSKILSLWGLASPQEASAAGMPNEQLAWTGGAESLSDFLDGFVAIGDGAGGVWTHDRLSPLQEYILSLRSPGNPAPPAAADVERGRALFASTGCLACHDGPRGMGRGTWSYEEIGTDDAMKAWADPELDGLYCCGFEGTPTHEVKSPRLVGLWAQSRFLHNGSVASLEELVCLAPRTPSSLQAQGSEGHDYGCGLSTDERAALVAFLRSL